MQGKLIICGVRVTLRANPNRIYGFDNSSAICVQAEILQHYLHHMLLINTDLDVSGYKKIASESPDHFPIHIVGTERQAEFGSKETRLWRNPPLFMEYDPEGDGGALCAHPEVSLLNLEINHLKFMAWVKGSQPYWFQVGTSCQPSCFFNFILCFNF